MTKFLLVTRQTTHQRGETVLIEAKSVEVQGGVIIFTDELGLPGFMIPVDHLLSLAEVEFRGKHVAFNSPTPE